MGETRVQRRLAAILAADVVGYSRLMSEDEAGTLDTLKEVRVGLIDPIIAEHRGRIVKLMGDGALIEFASIVDAVECAVNIQRNIAEQFTDILDNKRIILRIGINLGDVIVEDEDIYGDGVNVAARLEELAEPGGICVSGTVFDQVKDKLNLSFDELGLQEVKNIAEPVRVYRIQPGREIPPEQPSRQKRQRKIASITGIIAATAVVAVGLYVLVERTQLVQNDVATLSTAGTIVEADQSDQPPVVYPDKPSIAVLAFQNMSNDPNQEYFADGMSEDIITGLSKLSELFVIARNSSFQYKNQIIDVKRIGRELGVEYVVEGSVRRAGEQVRITAQLIDTETGGHLWAERYDGTLNDVFALQDQVTGRIVDALSITLGADDKAKLSSHGTTNAAAHDEFLKGQELSRRYNLEDHALAIKHYKKALEFDPDYSRASAALGQLLYYVWRNDEGLGRRGGLPGPNDSLQAAKEYIRKALEKPVPAAHVAQALLLQTRRKYDEAIDQSKKAIALDPNDAEGYLSLAQMYVFSGEPENAIPHFKSARRFDPHNTEKIDQGLGLAYFGMDRFGDAKRYFEKARDAAPGDNLNWMYLTATYAHLGRNEDAVAAADQMNALRRKQGINSFRTDFLIAWYFKQTKDEIRLKQGLLKAGVPEKLF